MKQLEKDMKQYKTNCPELNVQLKREEVKKVQIRSSKDSSDFFRSIWDDSIGIYEQAANQADEERLAKIEEMLSISKFLSHSKKTELQKEKSDLLLNLKK